MKQTKGVYLLVLLFLFISVLSDGASAGFSATIDQITYVQSDDMIISGAVGGSDNKTVTATLYNSTGMVASFSSASSGGSSNAFSISSVFNSTYLPGDYNVTISSGNDTVNMSFSMLSKKLELEAYMVSSGRDIINVTTTNNITTPAAFGGNFSELLSLSKSGELRYGNYTIDGKPYHFVLVDQTNRSNYDRLYIDDDKNFGLYNDTEDGGAGQSDVEYQALKKSSMFSNGTFRYVVGEMERGTGDEVILWKPAPKTPSAGDNISFVILAKNDTEMLSEHVKVEVYNSTGQNVTATFTGASQNGWFNISLLSLPAGTYTVKLNDSMESVTFSVEAFKMFASISDTSNNPSTAFSPNSKARLTITSKNTTGPFNLTSLSATLYYPNGSTLLKQKASFSQTTDGIYTYDYDLAGAPTGRYTINAIGSDGTNSQTSSAGFEIQSVGFEAMAINTRYLEEADSTGAVMDAFPPGANVTIMTFLSNISAGGKSAAKGPGPESESGLINPGNCSSSVALMKLVDENGIAYSVAPQIMNLSNAMALLSGASGEQPPESFLSQCMIIFTAPNKTGGSYRAELKIKYGSEEKYAGVKFGIQRLYASGSTVDFKGDDFSFLAPNSTVRIKLKVTDLLTDQQLSAGNITSAKIIEMYKMFPVYKDILGNTTLRGTLGENVTNGTISFTSPLDEGFYMMKFRFAASIGSATETGIGTAVFMLKKYMVWGQLSGAQQGQWFVKQGQNATLEVTVMDINDAQTVFGGQKSQKTCTGCTGFEISASQIRNDQQFKVHTEGADYTILKGTIINSTNPVANLTIVPSQNMQSGWYSVDISVIDPLTNATYFGWGGFEIRNFWVDARRAYWNATSHNVSGYSMLEMGGGMSGETYGVNSSAEFVVIAREPNSFSPEGKPLSTPPVLESIMSSEMWPPTPISGYTASVSNKTVTVCRVMGGGSPVCNENISAYVINVSGLPDKQKSYMANVRVNVSGTTDVGTFRFSMSSYTVYTDYRRDSFPPLYSSTENLIINFSAVSFSGGDKAGSHNLTNVTVSELFSPKLGRPIKMKYGQNYTTNCNLTNSAGQYCQISVNLTNLPSGEYNARFAVVDSPNAADQKTEEVFFRIQGTIISIPSIEETWMQQTDSASKKIDDGVMRGDWSNEGMCGPKDAVLGKRIFCGNTFGGMGWPTPFNLNATAVNYTKEIFGYISMSGNNAMFSSSIQKGRMCLYANGTHLWINTTGVPNKCDLTQTVSIGLTELFTDGAGGIWRLDAIGDQSITVTGQNTLYETGAMINTSYSKSGKIKFGQIWENNLGAFTRDSSGGSRKGIDLDGDGYANGTVYFAITDNASSGVYDTFFFSKTGNFTNAMSVNDANRTRREFGNSANNKDKLTLLSIDPKGERIRFYSRQRGDWSHLGDIKFGNNITIPVLLTSPDGEERNELISITAFKNTRTWQLVQTPLVTGKNISGIGELTFNTSVLGSGGGEFSFGLESTSDKVEEWKWPMATVRKFLVDGEMGEALYVNNFRPIPLEWKNWDSGIINIQSDRRNISAGMVVDGVLSNAQGYNLQSCTIYNETPIDYGELVALEDNNNGQAYYFLYNQTKVPKIIYRNATGCTFNMSSLGTGYGEGSSLIMNRYGRNYNMTVLRIDLARMIPGGQQGCAPGPPCPDWRIDFGVAGVDASRILPVKNNTQGNPEWSLEWSYLQNVGIFGQYYDVILANDSSYYYHWCTIETFEGGECAKRAWFVPASVRNFSSPQVQSVRIGENFTSELYIASMGPRGGEGFIVGNFSALEPGSQRPTIGGMPLADGTPAYFAVLNETLLGYDFDKNGIKNMTFYALAFDSDFNGANNATTILIDDDTQFLQFARMEGNTPTYIDFTGPENYATNASANRTEERWSNLPIGTSEGNIQFGNNYDGVWNWENQPNWNVPFYNNTHMLLKKSKWNVNLDQSVDILLKAYGFDLQPVASANISVTQVARSTFIGFQRLVEGTHYNVSYTSNSTDNYGYDLVKIIPPAGNWTNHANYQVIITVQTPQGNETFERWFLAGNANFGMGGVGGP